MHSAESDSAACAQPGSGVVVVLEADADTRASVPEWFGMHQIDLPLMQLKS